MSTTAVVGVGVGVGVFPGFLNIYSDRTAVNMSILQLTKYGEK